MHYVLFLFMYEEMLRDECQHVLETSCAGSAELHFFWEGLKFIWVSLLVTVLHVSA